MCAAEGLSEEASEVVEFASPPPAVGLIAETVARALFIESALLAEFEAVSTTPHGLFSGPHVTFGFELYLFKISASRISFGLSFDFAKNYENLSVAFLVWK